MEIQLMQVSCRWVSTDIEACLQSLQYWLGGSAENLENLLLNTAKAYTPDMKGSDIEVLEPQLFPDIGIWHPMAPSMPLKPILLCPPGYSWQQPKLCWCDHASLLSNLCMCLFSTSMLGIRLLSQLHVARHATVPCTL